MFYYLIYDGDNRVGYLVSKTARDIPNSVRVTEDEFVALGLPLSRPVSGYQEVALSELSEENRMLKAQLQAQSDRSDFIEDCIAEMAMAVYGEV